MGHGHERTRQRTINEYNTANYLDGDKAVMALLARDVILILELLPLLLLLLLLLL